MLHKPKGFVCTRSDGEGKTVFELLPMRYTLRNPPLVCVGRLDMDTTGLLLITDDGDFVHRMTSPRHHVEKEYCVTLEQPLKGDESSAFAKGGIILGEDEEPLIPSTFTQTGSHTGTLIITEGRYHQIKRTFGVLGNTVTELHRPRVGEYTLGNLAVGEFVIVR